MNPEQRLILAIALNDCAAAMQACTQVFGALMFTADRFRRLMIVAPYFAAVASVRHPQLCLPAPDESQAII